MSDCEVWQGTRNARGYGIKYLSWDAATKRSRTILAHRAAWQDVNGPVPEGLEICHHCNNPPCINPDHLYAGTHAQNMVDAGLAGVLSRDNRGDRNPARRLTAAQVNEIRAAYRPRYGALVELGRQYGVHPSTIGLAVRGRTWKGVQHAN